MVGEGCLLTSVPTLELQAWTGRGLQRAPPTPAQRAVGGRRAVGGSILSSGEIGWLVARGFILSKGPILPGVGAILEGLGFGEAPLLPQWKGPPLSPSIPQVGSLELNWPEREEVWA